MLSSHPRASVAHVVSPGQLLAPARRIAPFVGRTIELAALVQWCDGPDRVAIRLVSGPRGVGKTRLAREVADMMARAGWTCLDVPDGAEPAALPAVPDGAPALLVVDGAEARGSALADLLRSAARGRNGTLRVLLVAPGAGLWFDRLAATDLAVRALLEPARAGADLRSEVIPGQVDGRLVEAFVEPYARALGLPVPRVAVASVAGGARMLDLQAAALCAVMRTQARQSQGRSSQDVLPVDVSDALDELLEHERWTWFRSAEEAGVLGETGVLPEAVDALVAAATLTGVRTQGAAEKLVGRVAAVVPGVRPGAAADVGRWLLELDPHRTLPGRLVDPHLLAELTDTPGLLGACLSGASAPSARRAALRAAGAVTDRLAGSPEDLSPALGHLGAAVAALPEDQEVLSSVSGALPHPSLVLGELRVEVALRTLAVTPGDDPARQVEALREVGVALGDVGRAADAERYERKAITLLRGLAYSDPYRFGHRLAALLTNLGRTCSDQGRPEEALRCGQEAVGLLRRVEADHPGVVSLDLTAAVSSLAMTFAELGRPLAALGPSEEVARRRRRLADSSPARFGPALARSLTDVARLLLALGRAEAALGPAEESMAVRRRLAAADPDAHLSALGDSLQLVGDVLTEQGRAEEALPRIEEAVEIRRQAVQENPGRYLPDLAGSLQALGTQLSGLGRLDAGLELQREAVGVRRRLAADHPGRYVPELAEALSCLGVTYSRLDRTHDAFDVEREAARAWRGLAWSDPRHRPRLARSLANLSATLAVLRLGDEAGTVADEAVALLRELAAEDPTEYRPRLAEVLRTLALALHDQERFAEARLARAEAEELGGVRSAG